MRPCRVGRVQHVQKKLAELQNHLSWKRLKRSLLLLTFYLVLCFLCIFLSHPLVGSLDSVICSVKYSTIPPAACKSCGIIISLISGSSLCAISRISSSSSSNNLLERIFLRISLWRAWQRWKWIMKRAYKNLRCYDERVEDGLDVSDCYIAWVFGPWLEWSTKSTLAIGDVEEVVVFFYSLQRVNNELFVYGVLLKYLDKPSKKLRGIGSDTVNCDNVERLGLGRHILTCRRKPQEVTSLGYMDQETSTKCLITRGKETFEGILTLL